MDSARIEASVNKYQPTLQTIRENQQKAKSSDQEQSGNVDGEDSTALESRTEPFGLNFGTSAPDTNIDKPNKVSRLI